MKVLVTGVNGQLGFDVCKELDRRNIENKGIDRESCDITDENAVSAYIKNYAPDVVIHCAAYTAVDRAEDEKEVDGGRPDDPVRICADCLHGRTAEYGFPR